MPRVDINELLAAGCHFGHITRRWNPKMKPYIFGEKNGIHILDLRKTQPLLDVAYDEIVKIASEGKRILFVGTKRQGKAIMQAEATRCNEFFVVERWLGGLLTNFVTIRKSVKRLSNIVKMETDGTFDKLTKKEKLFLLREKAKLENVLLGIIEMSKIPGALFLVDTKRENIAVKEAKRLGIPVFAIVDSNCDPDDIDFPIPANDDATKSIQLIAEFVADAVVEGKEIRSAKLAQEASEKMESKFKEEKDGSSSEEKRDEKKFVRKKIIRKKPTDKTGN